MLAAIDYPDAEGAEFNLKFVPPVVSVTEMPMEVIPLSETQPFPTGVEKYDGRMETVDRFWETLLETVETIAGEENPALQ